MHKVIQIKYHALLRLLSIVDDSISSSFNLLITRTSQCQYSWSKLRGSRTASYGSAANGLNITDHCREYKGLNNRVK